MTLPNKLTIGRIIAVPLMVTVACIPALNDHFIFRFPNFIRFFAMHITTHPRYSDK